MPEPVGRRRYLKINPKIQSTFTALWMATSMSNAQNSKLRVLVFNTPNVDFLQKPFGEIKF